MPKFSIQHYLVFKRAEAMDNSRSAAEAAEHRPSLISSLKRRVDPARDAQ
jgi:hypothetical protein